MEAIPDPPDLPVRETWWRPRVLLKEGTLEALKGFFARFPLDEN